MRRTECLVRDKGLGSNGRGLLTKHNLPIFISSNTHDKLSHLPFLGKEKNLSPLKLPSYLPFSRSDRW